MADDLPLVNGALLEQRFSPHHYEIDDISTPASQVELGRLARDEAFWGYAQGQLTAPQTHGYFNVAREIHLGGGVGVDGSQDPNRELAQDHYIYSRIIGAEAVSFELVADSPREIEEIHILGRASIFHARYAKRIMRELRNNIVLSKRDQYEVHQGKRGISEALWGSKWRSLYAMATTVIYSRWSEQAEWLTHTDPAVEADPQRLDFEKRKQLGAAAAILAVNAELLAGDRTRALELGRASLMGTIEETDVRQSLSPRRFAKKFLGRLTGKSRRQSAAR